MHYVIMDLKITPSGYSCWKRPTIVKRTALGPGTANIRRAECLEAFRNPIKFSE